MIALKVTKQGSGKRTLSDKGSELWVDICFSR